MCAHLRRNRCLFLNFWITEPLCWTTTPLSVLICSGRISLQISICIICLPPKIKKRSKSFSWTLTADFNSAKIILLFHEHNSKSPSPPAATESALHNHSICACAYHDEPCSLRRYLCKYNTSLNDSSITNLYEFTLNFAFCFFALDFSLDFKLPQNLTDSTEKNNIFEMVLTTALIRPTGHRPDTDCTSRPRCFADGEERHPDRARRH